MTMFLLTAERETIRRLTDELAEMRGGDYTYDPTDAGYYAALDDLRAAAHLPNVDRSKRGARL